MSEDRSWDLPEKAVTPKSAFLGRRALLGSGLAVLAAGGAGYLVYRGTDRQILDASRKGVDPDAKSTPPQTPVGKENPGEPNVQPLSPEPESYTVDRPVTALANVSRYVNYYEFNPWKEGTWRIAQKLPVRPWTITVDGLVKKPKTFGIDDILKQFGREQRIYRHRCVETWAMVVPWEGFPLRKLLEQVEPTDRAKYVRFVTADIERLTGIVAPKGNGFEWPYAEGVTLAEAMHDLSFLATGFYGEPLFKQNGAPIRYVAPWKYGFKSAKSIVRIELVPSQPPTFWNTASPREYGFFANVNPAVDHPRWSQKTEWMIDTRERFPTVLYNGYEKWVGSLYKGNEV